jgi:hypothetical protein
MGSTTKDRWNGHGALDHFFLELTNVDGSWRRVRGEWSEFLDREDGFGGFLHGEEERLLLQALRCRDS